MGLTTVNAVAGRDYQLVVAAVLIGSVMVAAGSAAADLLAALADPRSRRQA
jgi:ABC-type dipeptide/oligopeptide/nickel transport system permease component